MKDFFSTLKFKLLTGVAVLLAGMLAWAGANGRLSNAPQEILGALLVPFQRAAAAISGGVDEVWTKYTQIDEILAENEQLKEENSSLRQRMVDYDTMKAENEAFKDLAQIQEENPEYEYASGFIIGRDPLEQFGGFTIDQGTLNGVEKNDVVVSDQGYLVGIVLEAGLNSSKVITILSPSLNAAGVVSRTRDNGILTGSAEYASQDTQATVGDEIITTGLGGVFPADILVGTVEELAPESSGKSMVAVVRPGQDIDSLKHVFVIVDRDDGQEE